MNTNEAISWTNEQLNAIQAGASERILVDAGPGTGKTATACARVAWLIEHEAVEPNSILMTSFTNAAVHEILNRISDYLKEPGKALGIRISTLDSFSWILRAGFNSNNLELKGFSENIAQATNLISQDENAKEYVQGIEHFIIDEAQDITGPRSALVLSIISNLGKNCGISIFSDEAQSIYGFSEDDAPEYFGKNLPQEIRTNEDLYSTFLRYNLKEIHRTNDEKLKNLFIEGRRKLLEIDDIPVNELYEEVRKLVVESHHEKVGTAYNLLVDEGKSKELTSKDFLLFRRRSDALQGSHYMGTIPYRLRLSGFPTYVHPWLARCFWDFCEDRISESDFASLYSSRTGCQDVREVELQWQNLHQEVGVDGHRISVRKLSNLLSRPNVPRSFSSPDYGMNGPIIGTIHASKGREADKVLLFVPNQPHFRKIEEDRRYEEVLEEARILFVGATRARETLIISDETAGGHFRRSGNLYTSKRAYTIKNSKNRQFAMEIGRRGDVRAECLVGTRHFAEKASASLAQIALWNRRNVSTPLQANSNKDTGYIFEVSIDYLYSDSRYEDSFTDRKFNDKLFSLDKAINSDMFTAGKIMGQTLKPPNKFRHFYSLGTRSMVLATDDPARENLFEPWSQSGFLLAPIMVGYPDIFMQSYGRG